MPSQKFVALETLEDRRLLSAAATGSATLNSKTGELKILGTKGADVINISLTPSSGNSPQFVAVTISVAGTQTVSQSFTPTVIKRVFVRSKAGDDSITVNDANGSVFSSLTNLQSKEGFVLEGGKGNDTITSGDGNDYIFAVGGNNVINATSGNNVVVAGHSATGDSITVGDGANLIYGSNKADTITTGNGDDSIASGAGDDSIEVGNGADVIYSGPGNDTIGTGTGADYIVGGSGNDSITTSGVSNTIYGGAGADTIVGDASDTIYGGTGNNTITPSTGTNIHTHGPNSPRR